MIGNYENRTVIAKDADAITKEMIRIVEEHLAQFNRLIFQDERDEVLYIRGRIPRSELDWGINFFAERMPGEKQIERKDVVLLYRSLNDGCNKIFRVLIITRQGLYFDKCSVDETCFVKWEYLESTWLVYLESNLSAPDIYNGFWLKFLLPVLGKLKQVAEGKSIDIQPNEQIGIHKKPVVESERLILQKRAGYMSCFDLVCGYEDIKAELFRICDVVNNPKKYDELDVVMPFGILLYGDHGMGKTLMGECFIRGCDCPVFAISKEEPDCELINDIRAVFAEAKRVEGKAIVFLDNLDDDADANVYAALKACMDDCRKAGVFVLAIAKDKDNIPDYLLRYGRFDKAIEMDTPVAEDTEKILNCYLSRKKCATDVDVKEITGIMRGNSCADLVMVVNEAAIYACENERKEITQDDLIRACLRRLFETPEKVTQGNNMELLEAAVHEAGHAVVAEILQPGSIAVTSIRGHDDYCEGVTAVKDDNDSGRKMEAMEHLIIRGLAGKAATEIVLGRVDMGCASDLTVAFRRVERMVDNLCAFGFETYEGPQSSEAVRAKKERLIATQMGMYYKASKQILAEHRTFLDKVTEELMRSKILRQKDIKRIRAGI